MASLNPRDWWQFIGWALVELTGDEVKPGLRPTRIAITLQAPDGQRVRISIEGDADGLLFWADALAKVEGPLAGCLVAPNGLHDWVQARRDVPGHPGMVIPVDGPRTCRFCGDPEPAVESLADLAAQASASHASAAAEPILGPVVGSFANVP